MDRKACAGQRGPPDARGSREDRAEELKGPNGALHKDDVLDPVVRNFEDVYQLLNTLALSVFSLLAPCGAGGSGALGASPHL